MAQRATGWTEKKIHQLKAEVKQNLDAIEAQNGPPGRLAYILDKIRELESEKAGSKDLELFIYTLSALVLQVRSRLLSPKDVKRLIHLAYKISAKHKLDQKTSRLSFIFGEFLMILGQVEREAGDHWQALWCQYTGFKVMRNRPDYSENFQKFTMANRFFRLGYLEKALKLYDEIRPHLKNSHLDQCFINQLRGFRLMGCWDRVNDIHKEIEHKFSHDPDHRLSKEIQWERMLQDTLSSGDLTPLLTSTRKGKSHHKSSYIIEAAMWAMSAQSTTWLERIPKMKGLVRNKSLTVDRNNPFYIVACFIQQSYDPIESFVSRLDGLGKVIPIFSQCVNIDKELLCWLASYRWLTRYKCEDIAGVCLAEYEKLCFVMTSGVKRDVLNTLSNTQ